MLGLRTFGKYFLRKYKTQSKQIKVEFSIGYTTLKDFVPKLPHLEAKQHQETGN